MKPMPRFLLFMLLFAASRLWAADIDKEFEEASWAEGNVQLPAFPLEENLIPFRVGSVTDTGYFIDGSTISIGADEVIRYALSDGREACLRLWPRRQNLGKSQI